jgi:hypothetical protein
MFVSQQAMANPLVHLPFREGDWWYCTQGQGGGYSHQGNQYYGFDFNQGSNLNSSSNPAYGRDLYAPVTGEVVEIRDGIQDFYNNSNPNASNHYGWGNTVVIGDIDGVYYIRMAHLQYGSLDHLQVGDWIEQGDYIGKVGQTGYSTSPHLHIQVMKSSRGSSEPFTFVEGKLYSYEWIQSSLIRRSSVLDNNNETSLSNYYDYTFVTTLGDWIYSVGVDGYAGKNYIRHKVTSWYDESYFKWYFQVKQSGWYLVFVTIPTNSDQDTIAKYYFDGWFLKTMDQATPSNAFLRYLTIEYMEKNTLYSIKVKGRTPGTYVVADAIVLRKF